MSSKVSDYRKDCKEAWKKYDPVYDVRSAAPDIIWDFGYIIRPEKPEKASQIINWGKAPENRKFPYYDEKFIKRMESLYINEPESSTFREFIKEENRRRHEGLFFYNGYKLEYITGDHYMFLQYWKIPVETEGRDRTSNPNFTDMNRDFHYCAQKIKRHRTILGMLFLGGRRTGKTAMSQSIGFWDTTAYEDSRFAIQSKNDPDAKKVFNKLVASWKRLPVFLKPLDTEETDVKSVLSFSEPKQRGVSVKERINRKYLNSEIFRVNSKDEALDGDRANFYYCDEIGKCGKGIDPYERWLISSLCLTSNGRKTGFSLNTTTVEDMEKYSSDKVMDMWNESPVKKEEHEGKIIYTSDTRLARLFFPAYYGYYGENKKGENIIDEWGYTNIERGRKHFEEEVFGSLKGHSLMSKRRKHPMTIDDCFAVNDMRNMYPQDKIMEQKIHNESFVKSPYRRGNFYWIDGEKFGEVGFHDDPNGLWLLGWSPPEEYRNKKERVDDTWRPMFNFCRTGSDPYSHQVVVDDQAKSKGAAITMLKSMPGVKMNNAVVCLYLARPESPTKFCEHMLMQSIYFSSPHLSENNKDLVNEYFRDNGFAGYLMQNPIEKDLAKRKKGQHGINMTSEYNRENLMDSTLAYLVEYCGFSKKRDSYGFIPFNILLDDLRRFETNNWTKYDLSVAFGIALIAMKERSERKVVKYESSDWFPSLKKNSVFNL